MRRILIAALLCPTMVFAQSDTDRAQALLLPMIQEIQPGRAGEVLTGCIISSATPEEIAAFAAAPGPSAEIGAVVNGILARPQTMQCLQAAAQG